MKLAFFTDTFFPQVNGVSRTMERQIKYLKNRGDEIIIFAPEYKKVEGGALTVTAEWKLSKV